MTGIPHCHALTVLEGIRKGGLLGEDLAQPFDYLNTRYATLADDLHLLVFHEGEHFPKLNRLLKALGK